MNQILAEQEEYIQSISHKWAIGAISTAGFWFLKTWADWQFRSQLEDMGVKIDRSGKMLDTETIREEFYGCGGAICL